MNGFAYALLIINCYMFILGLSNWLFLKTKKARKKKTNGPLVSVLVPARNEEENILTLLNSLAEQDYQNYEVLIIDDNSSDRTYEIAENFCSTHKSFRLYRGLEKKDNKLNGKTYALSQLEKEAKGEYILSTDSDTIHSSSSISNAVSLIEKYDLDLFSGFPKENCNTYLGSLCINAMNFAVVVYLPLFLLFKFQLPQFTLAMGQFMFMKRKSLEEIGGYKSIDKKLVDDVHLAKRFVKNGKKYSLLGISDHIQCNMYKTTKEAFWGIARSVGGIFPSNPFIIIPIAFVILVLLTIATAPIIALMFLIFGYQSLALLTFSGFLLFYISWYLNSRAQKFSIPVSLSSPLTLILISLMYLASYIRRIRRKNIVWKDRNV